MKLKSFSESKIQILWQQNKMRPLVWYFWQKKTWSNGIFRMWGIFFQKKRWYISFHFHLLMRPSVNHIVFFMMKWETYSLCYLMSLWKCRSNLLLLILRLVHFVYPIILRRGPLFLAHAPLFFGACTLIQRKAHYTFNDQNLQRIICWTWKQILF